MRLIDADALKEAIEKSTVTIIGYGEAVILDTAYDIIDNAPTVNDCPNCEYKLEADYIRSSSSYKELIDLRKFKEENTRPQGEYVDISKLRLMTVEECAGHTIDYAMGWKACVEWIKKGGAE